MKKADKIIIIVVSSLLVLSILALSVTVGAVILAVKNEQGMFTLFGKTVLSVQNDSMAGPNGFENGSLIIVEAVDPEENKDIVYEVGDVVVLCRYYEDQVYLDTHRIVEDTYTEYRDEVVDGVWIHGGKPYYVTKGDNVPDVDRNTDLNIDYVTNERIVAVWTGKSIPNLGNVIDFLGRFL